MITVGLVGDSLGGIQYHSVQVRWIAMPWLWPPRWLAWAVRCMCPASNWIQRCWNRCDLDGDDFDGRISSQKNNTKR